MRVPLSWLRDYVRVSIPPAKLAEALTNAGIEVEAVIDRRNDFAKIVVGEVVDLKPHPNADKLRLAYVRIKAGDEPQEIVCGAPNISIGQKVAVALIGATLPNGLTIEARKIRGIESNGMVCAEDELGLGADHSGIMILDSSLSVGMPFATALGFDDIVLDLAIPSNRSDLLSIRGVAREVAAILGLKWSNVQTKLRESSSPSSQSVTVKITTKDCARFTARVIRGITMNPTPTWIQQRLRQAGMRPINSVVDVTNYVMLAYGQPLHAYDAAVISGKQLIARDAKAGEKMTTLDGKERKLNPSMLVIADASGPVDLAGVMGGYESEIRPTTTDVILEAAIFKPVRVRRTARMFGLPSEASKRFEKGLPVGLQEEASNLAAALIVEICGGKIEKGIVVTGTAKGKPVVVSIVPAMFAEVLGKDVAAVKAKQILTRFGFVVRGTAKSWRVTVPAWRLDVTIPEDLVEEVGRVVGYNDLPEELPTMNVVPHQVPELIQLKDTLRDLLVGFGFTETLSHAFYGSGAASGDHIAVANPLDASQQFLRRSLLPQLQMKLELAADRGDDVRIFEIGRVFIATNSPIEKQQPWKLVLGVATKLGKGQLPGRQVKGVVEELLGTLGVRDYHFDFSTLEVKGRTLEMVELDVAALRDRRVRRQFKAIPEYPAATRDIAIWTKSDVTYKMLASAIRQAGGELLESVELFDVFDRDSQRSLAFHLTFRASDRTLTEEQISATMTVITNALRSLGAELR